MALWSEHGGAREPTEMPLFLFGIQRFRRDCSDLPLEGRSPPPKTCGQLPGTVDYRPTVALNKSALPLMKRSPPPKRHLLFVLLPWFAFLTGLSMKAAAGEAVTMTSSDWTLKADPASGSLSLEHDLWGIVLNDVRFGRSGVHRADEPTPAWTAQQTSTNRLILKTSQASVTWVFELTEDQLRISCTAPDAELTARTPAGPDRIPARIQDPGGTPVVWQGTGEVADGYGGSFTRNPSFLPRRNPTCMYFTLGPTSGSMFHSLFDRKHDLVLSFTEETVLQRDPANPERMDIRLPVPGNAIIRLRPHYFTQTLGVPYFVPFDDSRFSRAPVVWCSWTSYYGDVTEEAVVRNTDWLAQHLKPYGFQYVQIDDGYDRGLKEGHYWIEHWDSSKFPHGPEWLAAYIRSKGLHAGLWLVPNAFAGAVQDHPDWYVRDKQGQIIRDYGTPALDSTHPEVLAFLRELFGKLKSWGFDYYKFDGEHALPKYVPALDRSRLHDPGIDPLVAYRERLKTIRDIIGPEAFVEGCPAGTPLNGIGYFNSYFNGQDVYNNWHGMHALFSSINANAFLNHVVVYVMPGEGMELGPKITVEEARRSRPAEVVETATSREDPMIGFGVTLAEARTLVSFVALSGVVYPLCGVMPELPIERLQLLQSTLPPMPILPMDLFSRGTDVDWDTFKHVRADDYIHNYPEVIDLKVNAAAGTYDVVGLPNWRTGATRKTVSFADDLGLQPNTQYVVFDFWNQKLLGTFRDRLSLDIDGHDTRVVLIHPLVDHPQLLGTSRHISGAFSVRELAWDAPNAALKGTAETVPDAPYTVYIHVPPGMSVLRAGANAGQIEVPVRLHEEAELLSATFQGQAEPAQWKVEFRAK
jgi:hypothetical protein